MNVYKYVIRCLCHRDARCGLWRLHFYPSHLPRSCCYCSIEVEPPLFSTVRFCLYIYTLYSQCSVVSLWNEFNHLGKPTSSGRLRLKRRRNRRRRRRIRNREEEDVMNPLPPYLLFSSLLSSLHATDDWVAIRRRIGGIFFSTVAHSAERREREREEANGRTEIEDRPQRRLPRSAIRVLVAKERRRRRSSSPLSFSKILFSLLCNCHWCCRRIRIGGGAGGGEICKKIYTAVVFWPLSISLVRSSVLSFLFSPSLIVLCCWCCCCCCCCCCCERRLPSLWMRVCLG